MDQRLHTRSLVYTAEIRSIRLLFFFFPRSTFPDIRDNATARAIQFSSVYINKVFSRRHFSIVQQKRIIDISNSFNTQNGETHAKRKIAFHTNVALFAGGNLLVRFSMIDKTSLVYIGIRTAGTFTAISADIWMM